MNAIRLLLLFTLSFQTAASLRATSDGISLQSLPSSLQAQIERLAPIDITGVDHLAHGADSMETPCDLTDCEAYDSASDEGLREILHFGVVVEESKTLLPRPEPGYNFFLRYGIPPPEFL